MKKETFSNHIGNSSELTMIADIKPGLVPVRESISYASRLRRHLKMLSALRRNGLETDRGGLYVGPIDALRTLQYVKWTLIDNDTKMLLSVNFDRPLEPYIRRIVDIAGPLLDTILCHCVGFHDHYSDLGSHKFAQFPAKHQVPVDLFAAAAPNFSVDDADYFIERDTETRRGKTRVSNAAGSAGSNIIYERKSPAVLDRESVGKRLTEPMEKIARSKNDNPGAVLHQALSIIRTMHESSHLFPKIDDEDVVTRDDLMYYRLTEKLVPGFWEGLRSRFIKPGDPVPPMDDEQFWNFLKSRLDAPLPDGIDADTAKELFFVKKLLKDFGEPLDWFANRPDPRDRPLLEIVPAESDLQKPISNAPNDTTHACLVFLRVDDAMSASNFLRGMNKHLFSATSSGNCDAAVAPSQVHWTLSITNKGLESLGIPEKVRYQFPTPFREGMAERAGLLGDTDKNHPIEWEWPADLNGGSVDPSSIDLIVQIQTSAPRHKDAKNFSKNNPANSDHPLHSAYTSLTADAKDNGIAVLGIEPMQVRRAKDGAAIGHLNFADGISQPDFNGKSDYKVKTKEPRKPTQPEEEDAISRRGDILLGRDNSLDRPLDRDHCGEMNRFPRFETPLRDGTFQVIRKIEIDVEAFEKVCRHIDPDSTIQPSAQTIQEKMFGRKANGKPLLPHRRGKYNNFNFENDKDGEACPLQSHIRRANPRRHDTPRILRRGFSYGSFNRRKKDVGRGLFFIAYNADIAEQFEVIQRWVSGGNSTGKPSLHGDPLLAPVRADSNRVFRYLEKNKVVRVELPDQPLTTLKWGLYAFVPSREGLQTLAAMAGTDTKSMSKLAQLGAEVRAMRIDPLTPDQQRDAWKIILEDRDPNRREEREAIWAWIRESERGVYDTGDDGQYGILVGSEDGVRQAFLKSDRDLSVRDYWSRMKDSIGANKLGFDPDPQPLSCPDPYTKAVKKGDHAEDVRVLSSFIAGLDLDYVFNSAYNETKKYLQNLPVEMQPQRIPVIDVTPNKSTQPPIKTIGRWIDLERMIDDVAAQLSAKWFDLPVDPENSFLKVGGTEDGEIPHCPQDMLNASFYVFGPTPTPTVRMKATTGFTPQLSGNLAQYASSTPKPRPNTLLAALKEAQSANPSYWTDKKVGEALAGVTFGFVGPVPGSFLSVMYDWIDQDYLWRVQQMLLAQNKKHDHSNVSKILEPLVLAGMRGSPIPDLLYRRCVIDTTIGGKVIKAGQRITFSIASAMVDDPTASDLLFGGDYFSAATKPVHSCPGQKMGLSTIYGVLAALFENGRLRAEGPLTLRLDKYDEPSPR